MKFKPPELEIGGVADIKSLSGEELKAVHFDRYEPGALDRPASERVNIPRSSPGNNRAFFKTLRKDV